MTFVSDKCSIPVFQPSFYETKKHQIYSAPSKLSTLASFPESLSCRHPQLYRNYNVIIIYSVQNIRALRVLPDQSKIFKKTFIQYTV